MGWEPKRSAIGNEGYDRLIGGLINMLQLELMLSPWTVSPRVGGPWTDQSNLSSDIPSLLSMTYLVTRVRLFYSTSLLFNSCAQIIEPQVCKGSSIDNSIPIHASLDLEGLTKSSCHGGNC